MSQTITSDTPMGPEDGKILCKGTTKDGTPCKSKPMRGFEYCSRHQPTCSYRGPSGETCRNFVAEGNNLCIFHSAPDRLIETTRVQQFSVIDFIRDTLLSRREFLGFRWVPRVVGRLSRPVRIIGAVASAAVAQYLVSDFLDYFKETHGIEYLLPPQFKKKPELEARYTEIDDHSTAARLINTGQYEAHAAVQYVDYNTGQSYVSPAVTLAPNQSYIDWPANVPDGFYGGANVSSDRPLTGRTVVRLRILNDSLDVHSGQFLDFKIPVSAITPLEVQKAISIMAVGKQGKLQRVSDIPCIVRANRIYFDRKSVLDLIQATGATDSIIVIQLEGRWLGSQKDRDLATKYLHQYTFEEELFETTAEVVVVSI